MDAAQTEEQRRQIEGLSAARESAYAIEAARTAATSIADETAEISNTIAALEREAQVMGEVGWERERLLLRLEREAEIRPLLAQLADAEANRQENFADALRDQIDAINMKYGLLIQLGDEQDFLDEEARRLDHLTWSYRQLGDAGVRSLTDIALRGRNAGEVMKRLALTIAEAAIEASFMGGGPLATIMGTANSGGLLGGLLKIGSGKAAGGPVMPGTIYPVNEKSTAPGLFIPLMPGRIEPSANDNGGARAEKMTLEIRLANELLDAHFEQIAGNISVQVVRAHGPAIVEASAAETARRLTRLRI